MEKKRMWGIGFSLDYTKADIRDYLIKCKKFPYPERLKIVRFHDLYMVGYGFLPVSDPSDQANVDVLVKCQPTWYEETINV